MTAEIGIGLQGDKPPGAYAALARDAEANGIDVVSVFADLMFQPPLPALLEIAAATSRVRLGAACFNPFTLHPLEIAGQVAAIDAASGGRAYLGLARGTWLGAIGVTQPRPLTALGEAAAVVAALLRGDRAGVDGEVFRLAPGHGAALPGRAARGAAADRHLGPTGRRPRWSHRRRGEGRRQRQPGDGGRDALAHRGRSAGGRARSACGGHRARRRDGGRRGRRPGACQGADGGGDVSRRGGRARPHGRRAGGAARRRARRPRRPATTRRRAGRSPTTSSTASRSAARPSTWPASPTRRSPPARHASSSAPRTASPTPAASSLIGRRVVPLVDRDGGS